MRNKYYTTAIALLLLVCNTVFAQSLLNKTVDELLSLDAQEALANARQKSKPAVPELFSSNSTLSTKTALASKASNKKDNTPKELDAIAIISMYGVADALQAVISINGQTLTGVRVGASALGYTVESMSGRCIQFVAQHPQKNQIARVNKCYQPRAVAATNGQNVTRLPPGNAMQGAAQLPIPMPMFSTATGNSSGVGGSGNAGINYPTPSLPSTLPGVTAPMGIANPNPAQ